MACDEADQPKRGNLSGEVEGRERGEAAEVRYVQHSRVEMEERENEAREVLLGASEESGDVA